VISPAIDETQDAVLVDEILRSKCFERASALRKLLLYLWKHLEVEISEYAIATEALGRGQDFDSKFDATVRVQIGRLRRFLAKYYETEGAHSLRRVSIPVGSHELCFIEHAVQACFDEEPAHAADLVTIAPPVTKVAKLEEQQPNGRRYFLIPLSGAALLAVLVCVLVLVLPSIRAARETATVARKDPPVFWKQFIDNGKSIRIVLPAPLFFAWQPESGGSLMVRDITVNDPAHSKDSAELVRMEKRLGQPHQWQNYTVASDTFASLRLARFLDSYGIQSAFSSSVDSPQGIVDHENIVAFGTASSLTDYQPELNRISFRMGFHERYVIDSLLPPDTQKRFLQVEESGSRQITPGIVALLPRGTSGGRILLVQGSQTTALMSYLISEDGMRELTLHSQEYKNPFFEAVILSEVNEGTPIQNRLVAFRQFVPHPEPAGQLVLGRRPEALFRWGSFR
jgi:hypothetical protein